MVLNYTDLECGIKYKVLFKCYCHEEKPDFTFTFSVWIFSMHHCKKYLQDYSK